MFENILAGIVTSFLGVSVGWLIHNRRYIKPVLRLAIKSRRRYVRVSMAVLFKFRVENRFLLLRTRLRSEAFGPPGGVIKFYPDALPTLDKMDFVAESRDSVLYKDLRGKLPTSSLAGFLRWFGSLSSREAPTDTLRRELREELIEVGLAQLVEPFTTLDFRKVREVVEGPTLVPGQDFYQIRVLAVYEPNPSDATDALAQTVSKIDNPNLSLATIDEIVKGRADNSALITHTACYLTGSKNLRPDLPALPDS